MWLVNSTKPEAVRFKDLQLPSTPNYFVMAPEGFASVETKPESPIYDVDITTLEKAWHTMISKRRGFRLRSCSKNKRRYHYLERSLILALPHFVIAQLIPVNEEQSTLALMSYSIYGYFDIGYNRQLVYQLLIDLNKELKSE